MITATTLNSQKSKDLAQMAKNKGIPGWHSMRKEQLVRALLKLAKAKENSKTSVSKNINGATDRLNGKPKSLKPKAISRPVSKPVSKKRNHGTPIQPESAIAKKIRAERQRDENLKNLALASSLERGSQAPKSDRIILIARDAFWMQAYWEVTKSTVQRVQVALSSTWHKAKPVIRVLEVTSDGNTNSVENVVQEIEIHGGVKNWYLQVPESAKNYRVAIGYAVPEGRFHLICKSNQVNSPSAGSDSIDENWSDITNDVEKYYGQSGGYDTKTVSGDLQTIFEEKSRQPMNAPLFERLGSGINGNEREFEFQVDAHMMIFGTVNAKGSVTVGGEPVRVQDDGTFSLKIDLPDRRQVLPVVASSRDGTQQRTTVLAIERNTKVMEPVTNDIETL